MKAHFLIKRGKRNEWSVVENAPCNRSRVGIDFGCLTESVGQSWVIPRCLGERTARPPFPSSLRSGKKSNRREQRMHPAGVLLETPSLVQGTFTP